MECPRPYMADRGGTLGRIVLLSSPVRHSSLCNIVFQVL